MLRTVLGGHRAALRGVAVMGKPIGAYGLSKPMKAALIEALNCGVCCPRINTRSALIDRRLLWLGLGSDGRTAELTDAGRKVAKWVKRDEERKVEMSSTTLGRAPVSGALIDHHGDPWVRVLGGAVEVVMRSSQTGGPLRIFHPLGDFAECEENFGPFTIVEDA